MTMTLATRPGSTPGDDPDPGQFAGPVLGAGTTVPLFDSARASLRRARSKTKFSLRNLFGKKAARPARPRAAQILALVPAHNEEADIARTIDALLSQTRPIDRIVVILDNCTDGTEAIVRRYKNVTVQQTFGNIDKKVGALTQGWQRWAAGYGPRPRRGRRHQAGQ